MNITNDMADTILLFLILCVLLYFNYRAEKR